MSGNNTFIASVFRVLVLVAPVIYYRSMRFNLVPRARDPLGRGTKGSGIVHLIVASDWLGRNVAI